MIKKLIFCFKIAKSKQTILMIMYLFLRTFKAQPSRVTLAVNKDTNMTQFLSLMTLYLT